MCYNKGDYGLKAPAIDYSNNIPTYLRITDIDDNGKFMTEDIKSVDNPMVGCGCFTKKWTTRNKCRGILCWQSTNCCRIAYRPNKGLFPKRLLGYYINSASYQRQL